MVDTTALRFHVSYEALNVIVKTVVAMLKVVQRVEDRVCVIHTLYVRVSWVAKVIILLLLGKGD